MRAEKFMNSYREAQAKYGFLKLVLIAMVAVQMIQLFGLFYALNNQRVIIVPTSEFRKSVIFSGSTADASYIETMIKYAFTLYSSFSPKTVEGNYDEFLRFVHPSAYSQVKKYLEGQKKEILKLGVNQVFYISDLAIDPEKKVARLRGIIKRVISGQETFSGNKTYLVGYLVEGGRFFVTSIEEVEN